MAASPLRIRALGVDVALRLDPASHDEVAVGLAELWAGATPPVGYDDAASAPAVELTAGLGRRGEAHSPDVTVVGTDYRDLAARLSSHVTLAAIEEQKTELVMLHACGAAADDGRVVAFVGPSGRGKTTLASRVTRHYGYVTDETVGIRDDGEVLPYRKPLSVIDPAAGSATKTQLSPARLGLLPLPGAPLSIAAIALIERDPDAPTEPEVTEVELVDAIVRLVPELSYLPRLSTPLQRLAHLIDRVGGVVQLRYRDADDVPAAVAALLAHEGRTGGWSALEPELPRPSHATVPAAAVPDAPVPAGAGAVIRVPALDGLRVGARLVLLHGTEVTVLDGIGPVLWDALAEPATPTDLTRTVVDRLGAPAAIDAGAAVANAVSTLVAAGVLRAADVEQGAGTR